MRRRTARHCSTGWAAGRRPARRPRWRSPAPRCPSTTTASPPHTGASGATPGTGRPPGRPTTAAASGPTTPLARATATTSVTNHIPGHRCACRAGLTGCMWTGVPDWAHHHGGGLPRLIPLLRHRPPRLHPRPVRYPPAARPCHALT